MKSANLSGLPSNLPDGRVPHRLIHLDFESVGFLPHRRHGDPDHEGYVERLSSFFLRQLETGKLSYIAVVQAADGPQGLSEVFERTNSIDQPWVENEGVQVHPWLSGQRSTSVGDLIMVRDQVQMVDSLGFVNLSGLFEALQERLIAPVDARLQSAPSNERLFDFVGPLGFPMRAVLTLKGEPFLYTKQAPHDGEDPIIRLMDMRHWPERGGQMMSSYYLSTVLDADAKNDGIQLDGAVPNWFIEAVQVSAVSAWARGALGITADRQMACSVAVGQVREGLGGELLPSMHSGQWVTSTRDQLICDFQYLQSGADWPAPVTATAVFAPGSSDLVSVELVAKGSKVVLASYEADNAPAADLDAEQPDFSM